MINLWFLTCLDCFSNILVQQVKLLRIWSPVVSLCFIGLLFIFLIQVLCSDMFSHFWSCPSLLLLFYCIKITSRNLSPVPCGSIRWSPPRGQSAASCRGAGCGGLGGCLGGSLERSLLQGAKGGNEGCWNSIYIYIHNMGIYIYIYLVCL